jgi:hypothetical protein
MINIVELTTGIEPVTSPLPRECSTSEPRELNFSEINGAGEEVRTLDIQLGRLALYQLSYTRITILIFVVARDGFEPSKVYTDRFTVCCL